MQTILAALLISGTSIGAGILALPVAAGQFGFLPSILALGIACFFMTMGGLYLGDATLATGCKDCHLITLSEHYLGIK